MTKNSLFILFKKTDFNTILAYTGVRCVGGKDHRIVVAETGKGRNFIDTDFL